MIVANKPKTWLKGFINAIEKWKPEWVNTYEALYIKDIKDGTFIFKKVIAHFEKSFNKDTNVRKRVIIKAVFGPTFDGKSSEKRIIKRNKSNSSKKKVAF